MNHQPEDPIEALLRKQFEGPVADDGFCDRVMQQLPPRRRVAFWPVATGLLAGGVACWLSLASTPLLHAGLRDWLSGELSSSAIAVLLVVAGTSLLAAWWALAEANAR
ncbi:hypothetical protein [Dyella mobilis]|uniref:DUF5056 domain-containing protein n=1 Tax=Dyella mobilis TaxID=1849582 RepID=A0ABS2KFJ0_9GAMM|nr:hypothetical protein [Dyella mobilis]MBM7129922.1 hypothetical protein [Dyella mobilis]GLQ97815.1 hypothetical protein GCM10007863_22350 [Dyella mobilis]